ncbi:CobD/CbiB family protein [soil metagenome]
MAVPRLTVIIIRMSFFAVLFALLIEQFKPLPRLDWAHDTLVSWLQWTGRNFNAGQDRHAWVVWSVTALFPALLTWGLYALIAQWSVILALLFNVGVLYLTLGFRQFSHYFTDIRDALERGDEFEARRLLASWRHIEAGELPRTELMRHVIEHSLLAAHRHMFGVFFWFVLMSTLGFGPTGAVLYRMAEFSARHWASRNAVIGAPPNDRLSELSQQLFSVLDYVPARLTAFGFAVVGNFEEAVTCWRRDAALWKDGNEGVLLSAAAGAVGVQLGGSGPTMASPSPPLLVVPIDGAIDVEDVMSQGATPGLPPQLGHLRSIVGLVWRSVVLWMLLVALLSLAHLVG